jgi:MSHA pilin protein MshA
MSRPLRTAGFTLIELVVVVSILGILSAVALPKFANLGGNARVASLQAAKASLMSVSAAVHAKAQVDPSATKVTMEGTDVTLLMGYAKADQTLAAAAGLDPADFQVTGPTASTMTPPTGASQVTIVPKGLVGTAAATKCYIAYVEPSTAYPLPIFLVPSSLKADNCQ